MVAYGLIASCGSSGDVGASTTTGVGFGATLKGGSGSSTARMGSTSANPMFGTSASGNARFSTLGLQASRDS